MSRAISPLPVEVYPRPSGPLQFSRSIWDEESFEFPVYQLHAEQALPGDLEQHLPGWLGGLATGAEAKLVFCKLRCHDIRRIRCLCEVGFYYVESIASLRGRFSSPAEPLYSTEDFRVRRATPEDLARLGEIAETSFRFDRFHLDPHLPSDFADRRMRRWIERDLSTGERVDVCYQATASEPVGFISYTQVDPTTLRIGLVAVDPKLHFTTAADTLCRESFRLAGEAGFAEFVTNVSLNNLTSLNLCQSLGGRIREVNVCLHWFRKAGG